MGAVLDRRGLDWTLRLGAFPGEPIGEWADLAGFVDAAEGGLCGRDDV